MMTQLLGRQTWCVLSRLDRRWIVGALMKLPTFVASKRSQSSIRQLFEAKCYMIYMNLGAAKNLCIEKSRRDSAMLEGLTEMHVIIVRCMVFSALHPEWSVCTASILCQCCVNAVSQMLCQFCVNIFNIQYWAMIEQDTILCQALSEGNHGKPVQSFDLCFGANGRKPLMDTDPRWCWCRCMSQSSRPWISFDVVVLKSLGWQRWVPRSALFAHSPACLWKIFWTGR